MINSRMLIIAGSASSYFQAYTPAVTAASVTVYIKAFGIRIYRLSDYIPRSADAFNGKCT